MSGVLLLAPDFALIAIGTLLMRYARFDTGFWIGVEKLVYFILFPALLFHSIVRTPFDFSKTAALAQTGVSALLVGALLGFAGRWWGRDQHAWSSSIQCAFRFNSYVALALAGRLGNETGIALMAIVIGLGVPLSNALAVIALSRHSPHGLLRELMRNPLLVTTVIALLCNLAGMHLPEPVAATLSRLGSASIALGLIAVGAGLRLEGLRESPGLVAYITTVKLVAVPSAALGIGMLLGLHGLQLQIAVLFAALPTASSAYILAQRMGGNGPLVALLISLGTVVSAVTLPLWITAVQWIDSAPP